MQPTQDHDAIIQSALALGATYAANVDVSEIKFYPEVRRLCDRNVCGSFGKNWQCPPHVGKLKENAAVVRSYAHGVLVQTVGELEDSYDIEGMGRIQTDHQRRLRDIAKEMLSASAATRAFAMGAGSCDVCPRCTILDGEPCRIPEKIMPSVEAFGMNVKQVVESCGLSYINGQNTVSYVGVVLYDTDSTVN